MTLSFIKTLCFIDLHLEANYCHLNRFNVENHTTKGTITMSYVIALSAVTTTTEQEYLTNKKECIYRCFVSQQTCVPLKY